MLSRHPAAIVVLYVGRLVVLGAVAVSLSTAAFCGLLWLAVSFPIVQAVIQWGIVGGLILGVLAFLGWCVDPLLG